MDEVIQTCRPNIGKTYVNYIFLKVPEFSIVGVGVQESSMSTGIYIVQIFGLVYLKIKNKQFL